MTQFNPFWFSEMLDKVFGRKKYEKEIPLVKHAIAKDNDDTAKEVVFWAIVVEVICFLVMIIIFVATRASR